ASFASADGGAFAIAAASDYRGEITTGAGWTTITKEKTSSPEINAVGEHLTIPAPPIPSKPPAIYSGIYWIHPGKRNDTLYNAIYYVNYVYSPTVYTQVVKWIRNFNNLCIICLYIKILNKLYNIILCIMYIV